MGQLRSALSGKLHGTISRTRTLAACLAVAALLFPARSGQGQPLTVDLDGDGRLDLLVPDATSPQGFFVAETDGAALSGFAGTGSKSAPDRRPPALIVCDWNADNLPDVLTHRAGEPLALWLNQGGRRFAQDEQFGRQVGIPWQSVEIADFTGSPYPSLVGRTDASTVVVIERRDAHTLEWSHWREPEPGAVTVEDVDGDGRLDVVVGSHVRLRTVAGWSGEWVDRASFPEQLTVRLRLVGPPGNPRSLGARVTLLAPTGDQTHWLFPPRWNPVDPVLELVLPTPTARGRGGIIARWPDGTYSMTARELQPGSYELRAVPPSVDPAPEWSAGESPSSVRWRLISPLTSPARDFWTVVRTGVVGDPEPVAFDETGEWVDWRPQLPLEPGESCILSYAGNPVSVRTVPPLASKLLPFPVLRDSLPRADGLVIADADGDGMVDLIERRGPLDSGTFRIASLPPLLAGETTPGHFIEDRPGHRMWWHIVQTALQRNRSTSNGERAQPWVDGAPPDRIRNWQQTPTDVTGDGRLDLVALSPDGVVEVYEGTDGRPSGRHLVSGSAQIGPVGPRDTTTLSAVNPLREPIVVTALRSDGPLRLGEIELPIRVAPGDTLSIPIHISPQQHESFVARITLVSEQVDRGTTDIPVQVTIGLPADAPFLRMTYDFGVVQRDSLVRASVRVPWVRLQPGADEPRTLQSGDALVTVTPTETERDTVRLNMEFVALAVGEVKVSCPLRRGEISLRATGVDTIPPTPTRPVVRLRGDSVIVQWSPADAPDLDHYEVERLENGKTRRWVADLDTTWLDLGLSEGQSRGYAITAVDVTGNRGTSDTVFVTRPDETPPTITLVDPPPGAHDVALQQLIRLVIADSLSGVVPESLRLWVDGNEVPREYLRIGKKPYRCDVTYQPQMWPLGATVGLTASAADAATPPNIQRWTGFFTTVADTVVPVLWLVSTPPVLGEGGTVRAVVSLPSDRGLVRADLIIRPAGRGETQALPAQVRGGQIEVDVPPALSPASGFFYRWTLQTDRRTYQWPDDAANPWRSWRFRLSDEASFWPRSGTLGAGRALLAPPVVAQDGDALSLLRADLYRDPSRARLYGFDAAGQRWIAQADLGPVNVGDAVAMTWHEAAPVVQTSAGETVALDSAYTITLYPRWNLVGQPFPYSISWTKVRQANADLPISSLWVEREELALTDVWKAWEGAWIYLASPRPRELVIPPGDTVVVTGEAERQPGKRAVPVWFGDQQAQMQMLLLISARSESRAVGDISLGWNTEANDAYDPLDIPLPPTPDSALVVRFPHHDWQQNPGGYAVDLRKPARGGIWRLAIDTDGSSPVNLNCTFIVPPPPGVTADLIDLMTQDSVCLGPSTTSHTLRDVARFPVRELAIVLGDDQFRASLAQEKLLAPSKLILYQNYPNPFNRETTVTYSVPAQPERPDRLRVVIYNMLGQPVRVLHDGEASPGVHTATWDGLDDQGGAVSSGLYFCELTCGRERRLQRLIYLR